MKIAGEEAVTLARHALSVPYADTIIMLALALLMLWLRLSGRNARQFIAKAALSLSGYLRRRPDQAIERALRTAFTQLDEELSAVLADRPAPRPRI